MWLDMAAIKTSVLPVDEDMLPSINDAEKLINNTQKQFYWSHQIIQLV